jgi:hypothetical protein
MARTRSRCRKWISEGRADYALRHDDLSVTIGADELAAFYKVGERGILDHDPGVLGLRRIEER